VIECRETQLVAIAEPSEQTVADFVTSLREHGYDERPDVYPDYETMVNEAEIDAMVVALSNHLHAPASIYALEHGLHVLCEKPPTSTADEMQEVARVASETGRTFMFARHQRFESAKLEAERLVAEGVLGRVYHAEAQWIRTRGIPFRNGYGVSRKHGGGVLLDLGVHILDDAWFIMGRPHPFSVSAASHCAFSRFADPEATAPYDADDAVIALVRFADGATLSLTTTFAMNASWHPSDPFAERAYPQQRSLRIFGDHKGLDVDRRLLIDNSGERTTMEEFPLRDEFADGVHQMIRQHTEFANAVRSGRRPRNSAEQAVELMQMLDAIRESADRGETVRIEPRAVGV
jgi:predicted dehydrogenase